MKKITIYILMLALIITNNPIAYGASRILSIDEVKTLAVKNSFDIKEVKMDLVKKDMELGQAKEGIRDIRKKESTVRYSLLSNIEFPEKHGLPKEIDLVTKIPKIQKEIRVLKEKLKYKELEAKYKAEQAFLDVILWQKTMNSLKEQLIDGEKTLDKIKNQVKIGIGSKDDLEYLEKKVKNIEKSYRNAVQKYVASKEALNEIIGINVKTGYTFNDQLEGLNIERGYLKDIVDYARENDFSLYMIKQETNLRRENVEKIRSIYKSRFGSKVKELEQQLQRKEIDYDVFYKKYKKALDNIDKPWRKYYEIRLLFFSIKIPYRWFQGEFDGLRYFEDEKYALFLSVIDRDKQIKEEEEAIKNFEQSVRDSFSTLKQMEVAYNSVTDSYEYEKNLYDKAILENKMGKITFAELEAAKDDLIKKQQTMLEMLIDYNKTISEFNLKTSGFAERFKENSNLYTDRLKSGDSFKKDKDENKKEKSVPKWYVKNNIEDFKFIFGVNIPDEYNITHYELYTSNDKKIGEKKEISGTIEHLPLAFSDTEYLILKLYNEADLKYTANIEGLSNEGEIILGENANDALESGSNIGNYNMEADSYKVKITLSIEEWVKASKYNVIYKDKRIAKDIDISNPFTHISNIKKDLGEIVIELYDSNNEKIVDSILDIKAGSIKVK